MCGTLIEPVGAPKLTVEPSPKLTVTLVMTAAPAPAATLTVNVAGRPALGDVAGPVIVMVGSATVVTFTVPVLAPTVAVTVAAWVVASVVWARPDAFVTDETGDSVPWSVLNATSTPGSALLLAS